MLVRAQTKKYEIVKGFLPTIGEDGDQKWIR